MRLLLICFLTIVSIASGLVHADDSEDLWPVVVNCIPEPTQPPTNWAYSGKLLMAGYAGIHAMQHDWETPRVEASFYSEPNGDRSIVGGQLSPDGKWYAVPIGERFMEISFNIYHFVHGVRLYSMVDDTVLNFDLDDYFGEYIYFAVAWSYLPVEWVDSESFIIGGIRLYPFESRSEEASFDSFWVTLYERSISPDQTRAYSGYGIDNTYLRGLYNPEEPEATFREIGNLDNVVWKRDSSGFIAQETAEEQWNGLSLFDRDGQKIERLLDLESARLNFRRNSSGRNESRWSPNNSHFVFSLVRPYPEPDRLYLIDFQQKQITDTCLNPLSNPVWSPDGKQIAYLELARENLKVVIVDIESWHAYDVARHSGISGALQPDMIGWLGEVSQ